MKKIFYLSFISVETKKFLLIPTYCFSVLLRVSNIPRFSQSMLRKYIITLFPLFQFVSSHFSYPLSNDENMEK